MALIGLCSALNVPLPQMVVHTYQLCSSAITVVTISQVQPDQVQLL